MSTEMSAAQILFAWTWSEESGVRAADFQDQWGTGGGLVRYPDLGIKPQPIQMPRELLNISSIKHNQRCLCFLPGQVVILPKPSLIPPAPLLLSPVPSSHAFPSPQNESPGSLLQALPRGDCLAAASDAPRLERMATRAPFCFCTPGMKCPIFKSRQ